MKKNQSDHAEYVEQQMRHGRLHRPSRLADGGQYRRDTGADIGAERQRDTGRKGDQALGRHDDNYTRGRRGGLDKAGERRGD